MNTDKTGTFVILSSLAIGFFAHWVWMQDLLSVLGGIFSAMVAMNLTAERFYQGDKEGEYKMLFVLQGMQLSLLLLIAKLDIVPVFWLTVFVLGVLRISYICWRELSG